jgi:hypothetical protein
MVVVGGREEETVRSGLEVGQNPVVHRLNASIDSLNAASQHYTWTGR